MLRIMHIRFKSEGSSKSQRVFRDKIFSYFLDVFVIRSLRFKCRDQGIRNLFNRTDHVMILEMVRSVTFEARCIYIAFN